MDIRSGRGHIRVAPNLQSKSSLLLPYSRLTYRSAIVNIDPGHTAAAAAITPQRDGGTACRTAYCQTQMLQSTKNHLLNCPVQVVKVTQQTTPNNLFIRTLVNCISTPHSMHLLLLTLSSGRTGTGAGKRC